MIAKRGIERVVGARSLNQSSVHLRARYRETIRILRTELFPKVADLIRQWHYVICLRRLY